MTPEEHAAHLRQWEIDAARGHDQPPQKGEQMS